MATPSRCFSFIENTCAAFPRDIDYYNPPDWRARVQEAVLECEELWSVWDAVTSHQVRASNLPLIYVNFILKRISEERKAFYVDVCYSRMRVAFEPQTLIFEWEKLHYDVVGRFMEKLMVLLRSSTTQAEEEDVLKQTEAVERMYEAEVQDRVPRHIVILLWEKLVLLLPGSTPQESLMQYLLAISTLLYAVVVSSVSLLLFVYRYLTGYVDRGGTLTCSSGSSQFRATFICVLLYDGAYVWIKFRDVASTVSGVKRRSREEKPSGTLTPSRRRKLEARYTPLGQSGNHIYLGMCNNDEEKKTMKRIAASLDGRDEGQLALGGDLYYQVPLKLREEGEGLSVEERRKWLAETVREVYKSSMDVKAIDPASQHPSEDDAEFFSFLKAHVLGSPSQETRVSDVVPGLEDVCNGAAASNEQYMGEVGVQQESAFGELPTLSSFFFAQGVQKSDVATPAGVNFDMGVLKLHEFAKILMNCTDEEFQELKQRLQEQYCGIF